MLRSIQPLHVFSDIAEFARRHKAGTEAEFGATQKLVDELNKKDHRFQGWLLSKIRQTSKRSEYLVLVQPGPDGERRLPQLGEPAKLRLVLHDGSVTRFWEARRIESPMPFLSTTIQNPEKVAAFHVTVYLAEAHEGVETLIHTSVPAEENNSQGDLDKNDSSVDGSTDSASTDDSHNHSSSDVGDSDTAISNTEPSDGVGEIMLTDDNAIGVSFLLIASESTKDAELNALNLLYGRHVNASERQIKAFEYFVLLRDPEFYVDLHEQIPHLLGAMRQRSWPSSPLGKKFALLNPQQRDAYIHGFRRLQCGICILPGGPGAGKTHFNLFTIAMAQSQPLPSPVMVKGRPERRCAKVLFIVDMNSPVDDVANRAIRLFKELGMKKSVIRMKGWGAEVKLSDRLNSAEDAASEDIMQVDFTNQFLRTANLMSLGHGSAARSCRPPTLDEAAWQRYDQYKLTKYDELTKFLDGELWGNSDVIPQRFRRCVYNLYRDTLAAADFIATTPVAASNHFKGMFKPDLIFFDESPHARELCNLIAIANFDPIAWFFCGDYRQTVPYVGSTTADCDNIYREQMQVSMMERAAVANAIPFELLMNHRSFGGLHELASTMWYGDRMVSGNDNLQPASLRHIREYLSGFMGGRDCSVPRLLVHVRNCGPEGRDGTSAWNPTHTAWVMARVRELINDEKFKHAERDEPGTILIISPYKKAFLEYKNAIKRLPYRAQWRVETRTVDVVQGHEADFVFLDLVKEKSTEFLDNPNRLCVAVTRARVGEIIMMHPHMVESKTFLRKSQNLRPIWCLCKRADQVVWVDPEPVVTPPVEGMSAQSIRPSASAASTVSLESEPKSPEPTGVNEIVRHLPNDGFQVPDEIVSHGPGERLVQQEDEENGVSNVPTSSTMTCPTPDVRKQFTHNDAVPGVVGSSSAVGGHSVQVDDQTGGTVLVDKVNTVALTPGDSVVQPDGSVDNDSSMSGCAQAESRGMCLMARHWVF